MLPAFLATFLFALSAVSATRIARILGPAEANFVRLFLATVLLGLWAHLFGHGLRGRAFPIFFLSGCVGFGLGDLALFQSLVRLGSRLTILLVHCLAAPMAGLLEWLWLGTTLTSLQIAGAALILFGVFLAFAPAAPGRSSLPGRPDLLAGVAYGVLAAFGQALGAVLSRKAIAVGKMTGESIDGMSAAYQRILGGLLVVTLFLLWRRPGFFRGKGASASGAGGSNAISGAGAGKVWGWAILNALTGPTLGVSCYQWALQLLGTGLVLPIIALTPLVVMPFSRVLEADRPGWLSVAGAVVAVAGVIILSLAA